MTVSGQCATVMSLKTRIIFRSFVTEFRIKWFNKNKKIPDSQIVAKDLLNW